MENISRREFCKKGLAFLASVLAGSALAQPDPERLNLNLQTLFQFALSDKTDKWQVKNVKRNSRDVKMYRLKARARAGQTYDFRIFLDPLLNDVETYNFNGPSSLERGKSVWIIDNLVNKKAGLVEGQNDEYALRRVGRLTPFSRLGIENHDYERANRDWLGITERLLFYARTKK